MSDPYAVMGVGDDWDDAAIRRRYLELVREFSPEKHPAKFAAIRQAYESLRDQTTRVRHRLFESGKQESIDALVEEITCRSPRRRLSLEALLAAVKKG
jgi:curved DNA-binding protein CbpA